MRPAKVAQGWHACSAYLPAPDPVGFEPLALLLPAVFDEPRTAEAADPLTRLCEATEHALATGDSGLLHAVVAADLPPGQHLVGYVDKRVAAVLRLRPALRQLPPQVPVATGAASRSRRS
ncbi:hypothetical protein M8C13_13180 [Crossiella sp. SN42]|uniref:hypothetical protein n=1 Tax=Crossiella sp. SN42 TaxID=2944808 RepID=UPI00207CFF86|nr:hypothetical protein [Crossiella sp. SN42]MCO1576707.1 hypothetical protein [Crossiella sp. SN42]